MKVKLGDLVEFSNGYAFKSSDYVVCSNTVNCRMSNIRPDGSFDICHNIKFLPDDFATKYKDFILNDGDIIIAMTDMAGDPKILGVPTIVDTKGYTTLMNQRVGKLTLKSNNITPEYLKYSLISKPAREYFKSFAGGGVQLNIGKKEILNIQLNLHSLREQESITQKLNNITIIMSLYQQQLQQLDELVKARFVELFGDPKLNDKGWKSGVLSDYFEVKGGKRIPKGMGYSDTKTNHPYLRATDMKNETILEDDIHYISEEVFQHIKRYTVRGGDIYLTNVGVNLGMAGVIPQKFDGASLTENAVKLVPKTDKVIDGLFLAHYINSPGIQDYINERKMTVGVPKLAIFRIETMPLLIPPMEVQQDFIAFVKQTDKSKVVVQKALDEAQTLFDSLMQKYFG